MTLVLSSESVNFCSMCYHDALHQWLKYDSTENFCPSKPQKPGCLSKVWCQISSLFNERQSANERGESWTVRGLLKFGKCQRGPGFPSFPPPTPCVTKAAVPVSAEAPSPALSLLFPCW